MKKAMALLLTLATLLGTLILPAGASQSGVDAVAMVQALGIIQGDGSGSLNLEDTVTRAEFCKMLVAASSFKDSVGGSSGFSLFKDVKSNHWAVEYIKVCVENGWLVGYTDGTFRPSSSIKLEEAATAALRLLGYTAADLAGSYPTAQLSKFDALGLHAGFSTARGQLITRGDCANILYNLMATTNKSGQNYATTLGYQTDAVGNVDYASLVSSNTKGPYTLQGGTIGQKLDFTPMAVYRNGKVSTLTSAGAYDVYYYNANLQTVWIYSNRVTGTYTAASPSATAPTAVTVAGQQYNVDSSAAAYKLSNQGEFAMGDTITLLLGMNGGVADVCDPDQATGYYCGVVTNSQTQSLTDSTGKVTVVNVATVACTDGVERTYETGTVKYSKGSLVETGGGANMLTSLSSSGLSGTVSADGKKLGGKAFSSNVEILDTDKDSAFTRIYPSRLAGASLSANHILYSDVNTAGEITHLILRDVTGDLYSYGVLTEVIETKGSMSLSGTYEYIINGQTGTVNTPSMVFNVHTGPAMVRLNGDKVESVKNLNEVKITGVNGLTASTAEGKYAVSESCQVFIRRTDSYYPANITTVTEGGYNLSGYYDSFGYPAGKQLRIIVATAN